MPPRLLALAVAAPVLLVAGWLAWPDDGASPPAGSATNTAGTPTAAGLDPAAADPLPATPTSSEARAAAPDALGIPAPEITAAAAIVLDDASLAVLYDRGAHEVRPPASVTKIATAIVAVERRPLDDLVTSPVHYWDLVIEGDSSTMGLESGDVLTLRDMLLGLMLVSGNDAAIAIAEHVSGSQEAFVAEINALAERLGLEHTRFTNVAGLYEDGHYSTAWDLALLSRYLMRFPDLRQVVGTEQTVVTGERDGETVEFDLYNHNPLLNYTPGVDGVKTGFTEEAGRTFSVTAERDGHRVYIVLLDSTLRAQDSQALIEWAFENHRWADQATPTAIPTAMP
ncbi:MAG: D-alanyl-D-alanine carboxypeptidase [Dehalococcoidia bacterium]|nr:D-alanyl-D-alanine carboxypeptidase [Dehalococcoidia bacterium]